MSVVLVQSGRAAITVEPIAGLIRILKALPAEGDAHPPYTAIVSYGHLGADELVLRGFAGSDVTRASLALIARWAIGQGYRWIYSDRVEGRLLPRARRRAERPMKGWYECDLSSVEGRACSA